MGNYFNELRWKIIKAWLNECMHLYLIVIKYYFLGVAEVYETMDMVIGSQLGSFKIGLAEWAILCEKEINVDVELHSFVYRGHPLA